jgi:hypothetical protein
VKARFAYLIYALRRLVSNKATINYVYGWKEGMSVELRKRLPSKESWEVSRCLVERMKDVVGSITVNQTNGSNWLLSDATVDFIHVSLQCSCSNDNPPVEKRLQELLHEGSCSSDAQNLVINLKDLCQKIRKGVCNHLLPFLEPLIQMPPPEKYHPRFVNLKDLLELHSHEYRYNLDNKIAYSKPYIQQMKDKLLDYIAAAEKLQIQFPNLVVVRVFT